MKKSAIVIAAALSLTAVAHADGFVCRTEGEDLVIKAYNHTDAADGTRNASVMVLSDPSISSGKKTIARFTGVNETLTNVGASYEAAVDLRYNDSSLKGRNIGGTKLGYVKTIVLDVDFSYAAPVTDQEVIAGTLTLIKRDGDQITHAVNCARYLKN
jgi:hypothetical protein